MTEQELHKCCFCGVYTLDKDSICRGCRIEGRRKDERVCPICKKPIKGGGHHIHEIEGKDRNR